MQPVIIWAAWIANPEAKTTVLERAFTMRGINFHNKIDYRCMGFFKQTTQE